MSPCFVYVTAANESEADRIAMVLVQEGLAACINVLGPIRSIYRWQGQIHTDSEIAFIAKTTEAAFEGLRQRIEPFTVLRHPASSKSRSRVDLESI